MKTAKLIYFKWLIVMLVSLPVWGAPGLGRFVGILEHDSLKKQQLAKLDFIASRDNGNQLELMAVLTLHFGDFKSQEYIAFHFDKVRYNILNKTLVFDQVDQNATILVDSFDGQKLVGRFRSVLGGDVGTLKLEQEGHVVKNDLPLIESVWGEYQGVCNGKETTLQITTARSTEDISKTANPFATYAIRGIRGVSGSDCGGAPGKHQCVTALYDSGEYNFYKNQLTLYGRPKPISCRSEETGLNCGGCFFKRVSGETSGPRQMSPLVHDERLLGDVFTEQPALAGPAESIQGEYYGYVYHEYLDRYQPVSVNLVTFQEVIGGASVLKMSAVATLYFGAKATGAESISYRFDIRNYPNPLGTMQFVFARPENDVDAVLQVMSLGKGEMKGIWYSQLFGRVGKFALKKGPFPELPKGTRLMESILGLYESTTWDLDLYMRPEESAKTPANTENPFYPRTFDGGFMAKSGATPRIRITGGSYDFYTGRIALDMGGRLMIGQRESQREFSLRTSLKNFIVPLLPFELEPFRYLGEPGDN